MRRLLMLLLAFCLLCFSIPGSAWAAQGDSGESTDASETAPTDIATCKIYTRPKDEAAFHSPSALIMVYDGDKLLRNSYDYSISYTDIQDDGSMLITVTGIGDYCGSVEVQTALTRVEQPLPVSGVPQDYILCGQSVQIEVSGIGEIRYASNNPSIAEVDEEGWITGIRAGIASITISAAGNRYYKPAERTIEIRVINPSQKNDSTLPQSDRTEKDFDTYLSNLFLLWSFLNSAGHIQRWADASALWRYEDARQFEELRTMAEAQKVEQARNTLERVTLCAQCGAETATDNQTCDNCGQPLEAQEGNWGQWSEWRLTPIRTTRAREVERRQTLVGYNLFCYRTKLNVEPYARVYRDFSMEDELDAFCALLDYGEEYVERYAALADVSFAARISPNPWEVYPGKGYQDGVTIAFDLGDDDNLWFLGNAVYKTEYRYRELKE